MSFKIKPLEKPTKFCVISKRISNKVYDVLKAHGLHICYSRYWDEGDGEQLENKNVFVNFANTFIFDREPRWEESYTDPKTGFVEKWIPDVNKYLKEDEVVQDAEFYKYLSDILEKEGVEECLN